MREDVTIAPRPRPIRFVSEGDVYTCILCRFAVLLDDTLVTTARGGCICLRCYLRNVEDQKAVPEDLYREVSAVAAAA